MRGGVQDSTVRVCVSERERAGARVLALAGAFPRWEAAQGRREWFLVAMREWMRGTRRHPVDAVVSSTHLLELLAPGGAAEDIAAERGQILATWTFVEMLRTVADAEHCLACPSFQSGWRGPQLYPEQRAVAAAVRTCLDARLAAWSRRDAELPSLLVRFCTPPSTGKSSAAAYLGSMFFAFWRPTSGFSSCLASPWAPWPSAKGLAFLIHVLVAMFRL